MPLATAVYMVTDMTYGTNIMRHWTAILVFLNAIPYIEHRELKKFLICVLIAAGFHKSVIMYMALYWIVYKPIKISIKVQIIIILAAIYLGTTSTLTIVRYLTFFIPDGYYDYYASQGNDLEMNESHIDSGVGMFLIYICNILVVLYSEKMSKYYQNNHFDIVYSMFFYGCVLYGALIPFGDDQRLSFYLYCTRPIMLAFLLHYLWSFRKKPLYYFIWLLVLAPLIKGFFDSSDIVFINNMELYPDVMFKYNTHLRYG